MASKLLLLGALAVIFGIAFADVQKADAYAVSLRLAGSTVPSRLLAKWNVDFSTATNGAVNAYYSIQQTGAAKSLFMSNAADFVLADVPLSADEKAQVEEARGSSIAHAPLAITGVALSYNADSLGLTTGTPLQLDSPTLAAIFSGQITAWNDSRLVELNPSLAALGNLPVKPVIFDGQAGTTYILTRYLIGQGAWTSTPSYSIGGGPNAIHVTSPSAIVDTLKATAGAIGYVTYGDVISSTLPSAAIKNANAQFVQPSLTSFTSAAEGVSLPLGTDVWADDLLLARPSDSGTAYPISFFVYAIFNVDQQQAGVSGAATGAWLFWSQSAPAQAQTSPYGFSQLNQAALTNNNNTLVTVNFAPGVSSTDYWPYVAPVAVQPTQPVAPTPIPIHTKSSSALQVIIIIVLVIAIIVVVGIDQYRGGCIIHCKSTGRGVWA